MSGISTKQIKTRIRSLSATRQITKAMEMVASSKLRRAQAQAVAAKPYFETLYGVIQEIAAANRERTSLYLQQTKGEKVLYVVIAGDRGLAGGYNSNMFNLVHSRMLETGGSVFPIGKKAAEYFAAHLVPATVLSYTQIPEVTMGDCFTLAKELCNLFRQGHFDRIYIAYTDFVSVLSQVPYVRQILPLDFSKKEKQSSAMVLYEPDSRESVETIIPEYVGGILYGGLCESRASEHAARRAAMDAATKNADEMIEDLSLRYNRVRQAAITQEITEIVAGAKRS